MHPLLKCSKKFIILLFQTKMATILQKYKNLNFHTTWTWVEITANGIGGGVFLSINSANAQNTPPQRLIAVIATHFLPIWCGKYEKRVLLDHGCLLHDPPTIRDVELQHVQHSLLFDLFFNILILVIIWKKQKCKPCTPNSKWGGGSTSRAGLIFGTPYLW